MDRDRSVHWISHDLHPEEMLDKPKIIHFEFTAEWFLDASNFIAILSGDEQIVHPDRDPNLSFVIHIQTRVCLGLDKANLDEESMQSSIPNS